MRCSSYAKWLVRALGSAQKVVQLSVRSTVDNWATHRVRTIEGARLAPNRETQARRGVLGRADSVPLVLQSCPLERSRTRGGFPGIAPNSRGGGDRNASFESGARSRGPV